MSSKVFFCGLKVNWLGEVQCSNSRDFSTFSPVTGDLCGQRNRNTTVARCRSHCHMQGMK